MPTTLPYPNQQESAEKCKIMNKNEDKTLRMPAIEESYVEPSPSKPSSRRQQSEKIKGIGKKSFKSVDSPLKQQQLLKRFTPAASFITGVSDSSKAIKKPTLSLSTQAHPAKKKEDTTSNPVEENIS